MASLGFKITPLDLRTGRSWLVTGTINRQQIRRQFSHQEEAEKFRDEQDAVLFGRDANKAPVRTHLSNPHIEYDFYLSHQRRWVHSVLARMLWRPIFQYDQRCGGLGARSWLSREKIRSQRVSGYLARSSSS